MTIPPLIQQWTHGVEFTLVEQDKMHIYDRLKSTSSFKHAKEAYINASDLRKKISDALSKDVCLYV